MVRAEMNSQYRISVIVPVYNKKKYLGACVDSILGQTYRNLELVLVDDASTETAAGRCATSMPQRMAGCGSYTVKTAGRRLPA